MKIYIFLFSLTGLFITESAAQTKASVTQLSFLSGTWKTQHAWGDMTEIWSQAEGESLMCTYRCMKDGLVLFYEWIIIEQGVDGPVMKLRHFHAGSIAWEDQESPHTYRLVISETKKCVFENEDGTTRIAYELIAPNTLVSWLERTDKDGKYSKETFTYSKAD